MFSINWSETQVYYYYTKVYRACLDLLHKNNNSCLTGNVVIRRDCQIYRESI